jgi:hypothetical protein
MKKKQPLNTFLILGVGVIFAAGFLLGSVFNRDSSTSILDEALNKILDNSATETDKDSVVIGAIKVTGIKDSAELGIPGCFEVTDKKDTWSLC